MVSNVCPKSKMAAESENFQFFCMFYPKYHWNNMYLYQTEPFKLKIVDLDTHLAGKKHQVSNVLSYLKSNCQNAGPG